MRAEPLREVLAIRSPRHRRLRPLGCVLVAVVLLLADGGAAADTTHVVRKGETLAEIAKRHGATVKDLVAANGLRNANLIVIGSQLVIPGPAGTAASGGTTGSYKVRPGDTLAAIARRTGTTVKALVAANGLGNANLIVIGSTLAIPGGGASSPAAPGAPLLDTGITGTHQVQPGDTLAGIAKRYGVSLEALAQANGLLAPYRIYNGTVLQLGARGVASSNIACPVPGATYFNDWGFPRAGGRFHEGNDLFAPAGTPVLAPVDGTVTQLRGKVGGLQFRLTAANGDIYIGSHLQAFGAAGPVSAGTVIGAVGDSGNAAGARPHLHFEIHPLGGPAVNPFPALAAAC